MRRAILALLVMLSCLALGAGTLSAQETDDAEEAGSEGAAKSEPSKAEDAKARELFMMGKSMYEGGRYSSALEHFEQAYELSPRPMLLLSLASTYERLERGEDALQALRTYLASAPPDKRDAIEKRITNLENLEKVKKAEAEAAAQREAEAKQASKEPVEESSMGTWGWVTVGVGAAVGIAGGALTLLGELDHREVVDDPNMLKADAQVLVDSGDDKKQIGYIVAGAGGAILTTGLVLVLLAPDTEENETTSISATFVPGPESATLAIVGRF